MTEYYEDFEYEGETPKWSDTGPVKNAFFGSALDFDTVTESYEDIEEDWSDVGDIKTSFSGSALSFDDSPYPVSTVEDFEEDFPDTVRWDIDSYTKLQWPLDLETPVDISGNELDPTVFQTTYYSSGGRVAGYRGFSTASGLIRSPEMDFSGSGSLYQGTLELWAKRIGDIPQELGSDYSLAHFGIYTTADDLQVRLYIGFGVLYGAVDEAVFGGFVANNAFPLNTWTHVYIQWSEGANRVYYGCGNYEYQQAWAGALDLNSGYRLTVGKKPTDSTYAYDAPVDKIVVDEVRLSTVQRYYL